MRCLERRTPCSMLRRTTLRRKFRDYQTLLTRLVRKHVSREIAAMSRSLSFAAISLLLVAVTMVAASAPCASNPCQNGGTCTDDGTDFTCTCPLAISGTRCATFDKFTGNMSWITAMETSLSSSNGNTFFVSVLDSHGDVYTAGSVAGTNMNIGACTSISSALDHSGTPSSDMFLAKLDGLTGACLWARAYNGSGGSEAIVGLALDSHDNLYIAGTYSTETDPVIPGRFIDFGNGVGLNINNNASNSCFFVAKVFSNGTGAYWAWRTEPFGGTSVAGLAVDGSDNLYALVSMTSTAPASGGTGFVTFLSTTLTTDISFSTPGNVADAILMKIQPAGNISWISQIGGVGTQSARSVAVSADGATIVAGWTTSGALDYCGSTFTSVGGTNMGLSIHNSTGHCQRAVNVTTDTSTGSETPQKISIDQWGYIYISGTVTGTADHGLVFPPLAAMVVTGGADGFVVKLDSDLRGVWAHTIGGAGTDGTFLSAIDGNNGIVVIGQFSGTDICLDSVGACAAVNHSNIIASGLQSSAASLTNSFSAKFDTRTGKLQWAHGYGSNHTLSGFRTGSGSFGSMNMNHGYGFWSISGTFYGLTPAPSVYEFQGGRVSLFTSRVAANNANPSAFVAKLSDTADGFESVASNCYSLPCQNSGTCVDYTHPAARFVCHCVAGYSGVVCQTEINECASSPCQNGGTCTDAINGFTCACVSDTWKGAFCQLPTVEPLPVNHPSLMTGIASILVIATGASAVAALVSMVWYTWCVR